MRKEEFTVQNLGDRLDFQAEYTYYEDMETKKEIKDIGSPQEEFDKLTERFKLLQNRLLAIAMDYKYYIQNDWADHEIFELRDNVSYRLYSARFHFQLLLMHHHQVENRLRELHKRDLKGFMNNSFEFTMICEQSTKEIYSLFDSMIYHLCSTFDYLCQVINYSHGQEILVNPKWNILIQEKNIKKNLYCSKELIPFLQKVDADFVYPLIGHRSELIHTKKDTGDFTLNFDLQGTHFKADFFATKRLRNYFPEIEIGNENYELTIKYASWWLIDKTLKTATEVLFELSEDMKRNRKSVQPMMAMLGPNGTIQSPSVGYWGDRNIT